MFLNYLNKMKSFIQRVKFSHVIETSFFCLILVLIISFSGCERASRSFKNTLDLGSQQPFIMVVKDQNDEHSREVSEQVLKALDYTKIPFFTVDF